MAEKNFSPSDYETLKEINDKFSENQGLPAVTGNMPYTPSADEIRLMLDMALANMPSEFSDVKKTDFYAEVMGELDSSEDLVKDFLIENKDELPKYKNLKSLLDFMPLEVQEASSTIGVPRLKQLIKEVKNPSS